MFLQSLPTMMKTKNVATGPEKWILSFPVSAMQLDWVMCGDSHMYATEMEQVSKNLQVFHLFLGF